MRNFKKIGFTEEMEKDFEMIRGTFKERLNINPSNTDIQNFLLKVYRQSKANPFRKNKSKEFDVKCF